MNNRMTKKKVVIQSPCNFTRVGLEALVSETHLSTSFEIVASTDSVEHCKVILRSLPAVDIVIIALSHANQGLISSIDMLCDFLPNALPSSKIVLMGNAIHMSILRNYFNDIYISCESIRLEKLQDFLFYVANSGFNSNECSGEGYIMLTPRQLLILRKLLSGKTYQQIANDLKLSYKTVSLHKCMALEKLGVRSLSSLIMSMSEGVCSIES